MHFIVRPDHILLTIQSTSVKKVGGEHASSKPFKKYSKVVQASLYHTMGNFQMT